MFKRSFHSKDRAGKSVKPSKRSFSDRQKLKLQQKLDSPPVGRYMLFAYLAPFLPRNLADGCNNAVPSRALSSRYARWKRVEKSREPRIFAAHEDVLSLSPFFTAALKGQFYESSAKRVALPDEDPQIFSCILEYLYKGDYYPRLLFNKRHASFELEDAQDLQNLGGRGSVESTVDIPGAGGPLLRDTVVYCAAERYGLDELKRLALRKQGLQSGIAVDVILRSARFAYENTPDSDSKLRAHYLALIIRSRKTFKRSGTMQMEMEIGGSKFFDLFVAMCNHVDDIVEIGNNRSPKTI
ncbi:MAG: hypothetical protein Q9182_006146 [Xanthomendoza sp. 2 TL-2023]